MIKNTISLWTLTTNKQLCKRVHQQTWHVVLDLINSFYCNLSQNAQWKITNIGPHLSMLSPKDCKDVFNFACIVVLCFIVLLLRCRAINDSIGNHVIPELSVKDCYVRPWWLMLGSCYPSVTSTNYENTSVSCAPLLCFIRYEIFQQRSSELCQYISWISDITVIA